MQPAALYWLAFLCALLQTSQCERLPRGFTSALYCSACRAVASEMRVQYQLADDTATIDTGSFRLSGSGKQPGLRKVPYRGSELHISSVLDSACDGLSSRYTRLQRKPDVFIPTQLARDADTVHDCSVTRALDGLCARIVDDYEDDIRGALRDGDEVAWAGRLCGPGGIVAACKPGSDPGFAADVATSLHDQLRAERDNASAPGEPALRDAVADPPDAPGAAHPVAPQSDSEAESEKTEL